MTDDEAKALRRARTWHAAAVALADLLMLVGAVALFGAAFNAGRDHERTICEAAP